MTAAQTLPVAHDACVAGLRTALVGVRAAVGQWAEGQDVESLDDASLALARAGLAVTDVLIEVPGHTRRARQLRHALDAVRELVRLVAHVSRWDWTMEPDGAPEAMVGRLRRAVATAERAIDAADTGVTA